MRTHLPALVLLLGLTQTVAAHSPLLPASYPNAMRNGQPLDIPSGDAFLYRNAHNADNDPPLLHARQAHTGALMQAIPSIHIGAFHLEFGGNEKKAHFAHYTLDGVRILGGGVSGSIDGRSARLTITWPSGGS